MSDHYDDECPDCHEALEAVISTRVAEALKPVGEERDRLRNWQIETMSEAADD